MISPNVIVAWVVFGSLGMIYFGYGKWKDRWQPKVLGVGLIVYPYFVSEQKWLWGVGITLSLSIFFARE